MVIEIDDALKKNLRLATRKSFNFCFCPGTKPENHVLILSKKRIPEMERKKARLESGGSKVLIGVCAPGKEQVVFETKSAVTDTHARALQVTTRRRGGLMSHDAVLKQNEALVEQDFEEEVEGEARKVEAKPSLSTGDDVRSPDEGYAERARKDIKARMTTLTKGLEWIKAAKPPETQDIVEAFKTAQAKLESAKSEGDFEGAVQAHDDVIDKLRAAMRAAAAKKTESKPQGEAPPETGGWDQRLKNELLKLAALRKLPDADAIELKRLAGLAQSAQSHKEQGDPQQAEIALGELAKGIAKATEGAGKAKDENKDAYEKHPARKRVDATSRDVWAWRGFNHEQKQAGLAFNEEYRKMTDAARRRDYGKALGCLADAEAAAEKWDREVARVKAERESYEKADKPTHDLVQQAATAASKGNLPTKLQEPAGKFMKVFGPFLDNVKYESYAEAEKALPELVKLAQPVIDANKEVQEAKLRFDAANQRIGPAFKDARKFAATLQKYKIDRGPLKVQAADVLRAGSEVNALLKKFEYDAAIGKLNAVEKAIEAINDAKLRYDQARQDAENGWKAVKDDLEFARGMPDTGPDAIRDKATMEQAYKDYNDAWTRYDYVTAAVAAPPLAAAVKTVKEAREKLDREEVEFNNEWWKISKDYESVKNLGARDKKVKPLVDALTQAYDDMLKPFQDYDYPGAKAKVPAVGAAITPLLQELPKQEQIWNKALKSGNSKIGKLKDVPAVSNVLKTIADDCNRLWKGAHDAAKDHDYIGGAKLLGDFETRCDDYLKAVKAHDKVAEPEAKRATKEVEALVKGGTLAGKTFNEKKALLDRLRGATTMSKDARKAQRAVYKSMKMDEDFRREDKKKRKVVVNKLTDTEDKRKEMRSARRNWKTKPVEERLDLLRKAIKAQCEAMGMPGEPPELVTFDEPRKKGLIENGYFNPNDGKIYINVNAEGSFGADIERALDLAFHENSHNYQYKLIERLDPASTNPLDQNDPEYAQALMFQLNDGTHAYVKGEEDFDTYTKQPLEEHAHENGPETAKSVLKAIKRKKTK